MCFLNPSGRLALAIDPLDGSSNIDVNVSIGTIFGIYAAPEKPGGQLSAPGHELIGGGLCHLRAANCHDDHLWRRVCSTMCWIRETRFRPAADAQVIPGKLSEFAINASNYRHWPRPDPRLYRRLRWPGIEGPRGKNFNMRWIASLVAETHRILTRGGIFLYPARRAEGLRERPPAPGLRMCARSRCWSTQAGGRRDRRHRPDPGADTRTACTHRTPFVFGIADKVARVTAYHDLPESRGFGPVRQTWPVPELRDHEQEAPHHFGHRIVRRRHLDGQDTPSTRFSAAKASRPCPSKAMPSTASTAPT